MDKQSWRKSRPSYHARQATNHTTTHRKFGADFDYKVLAKKGAVIGVIVLLFGSLSTVAALGYFSRQLPDIHSLLNRYVAESTKIYDRTGKELLWEIHGDEKRTVVDLDKISPYVKNALIAAEDKNFYKHKGFSFLGIIRAAIKNVLTGSSQGGSTLTQQMIKNTILTNEKTYTRKIKELILSREAEQTFSKDEILKIYLNTINYGGVNYGVEAASQAFFGKTSQEVSIAEAAVLAAVPQAPTRLSPYGRNIEMLMDRKNWVIDRMLEEKYITKEEAKIAKEEEIQFKKLEISNITAPHFVFYIRDVLAEQFGEEAVSQGGLKVITTLDLDKQKFAEESVTDADEFNKTKGATDAALVSLDAKTGEILAMVGSQDYFNDEIDGQVNVAIEKRQPGSSIKPIVYAAALERGFTPDTVVYDVNTNFAVSGTPYQPKNYDFKERGPITMRYALQGSLNIPAVKFLYLAGVDRVMKKLYDDLEYSTINKDLDCGLSLVLGGCEVTLLDHVSAFTAFARDGIMSKPAGILQVFDKKGNELYKFAPVPKKVWEEQTVRQLNSIMTDNSARSYVFGQHSPLQLGTRPVAAKTGTSNDYNDGWTMGYTPSFVTGVWVGNADGTDMKAGADGSIVAAPIWNAYMKKILGDGPVENFKGPDPLPADLKPVLSGQINQGVEYEVDTISGKLATPNTPPQTREKRLYRQDHNILYYVKKDDPRGQGPSDPAKDDPAFTTWENAVQDWSKRQATIDPKDRPYNPLGGTAAQSGVVITDQAPPTEYDDVHLPEFAPSLNINFPSANQTIESSLITVNVTASAPNGVRRIEYYIDNVLVVTNFQALPDFNVNASAFSDGFHTLKVVVYDGTENFKEQSIELNFRFPNSAPDIVWLNPQNNTTVKKDSFPLAVDFKINKPVTGVTVYFAPSNNTGSPTLIVSPAGHDQSYGIIWKTPPPPGSYKLFVEISDGNGGKLRLPNMLQVNMQ